MPGQLLRPKIYYPVSGQSLRAFATHIFLWIINSEHPDLREERLGLSDSRLPTAALPIFPMYVGSFFILALYGLGRWIVVLNLRENTASALSI